jgi:hypothetical protein
LSQMRARDPLTECSCHWWRVPVLAIRSQRVCWDRLRAIDLADRVVDRQADLW